MDGMLVINKPSGLTSFKVLEKVKRIINANKAGHTGTLDPLATGVLLICLGKATKLVSHLVQDEKEYVAEMVLGITTDSQDADGKVLTTVKVDNLSREQVQAVIPEFIGQIQQIPPMVSALHFKGERLYKLAREGKTVEREPRKVEIKELELVDFIAGENPRVVIRVVCSKGTYIRTLCSDIGERLGYGAHQSKLTRTRVGKFQISEAKTIEEIQALVQQGNLRQALIPLGKIIDWGL